MDPTIDIPQIKPEVQPTPNIEVEKPKELINEKPAYMNVPRINSENIPLKENKSYLPVSKFSFDKKGKIILSVLGVLLFILILTGISSFFVFPSSIRSSCVSRDAVNSTSSILGKFFTNSSVTSMPKSVGKNLPFSRRAYSLS